MRINKKEVEMNKILNDGQFIFPLLFLMELFGHQPAGIFFDRYFLHGFIPQ